MTKEKELLFFKAFTFIMALGMIFIIIMLFQKNDHRKFGEIDVERINIVEKDGTVKLIITNVERFPTGKEIINDRPTNEFRRKYSGMLFFNEDGMECGGLIYTGQKREDGHGAALAFSFDQYDGDQVLQFLTQDNQRGDQRMVSSSLVFNDRAPRESQLKMFEIAKELRELREHDPDEAERKQKQYIEEGLIGSVTRVMLGQSRSSKDNGLFLFDDKGVLRVMLYVDKDNNPRLDFLDELGQTVASWPER